MMLESMPGDQEFLEGLLRTWEAAPDLEVFAMESAPCCNVGDNYMSALTRVTLTARKEGGRVERKVVLKRPPASAARCEAFRCDPAFKNEAAAYSRVVPSLAAFARIPLPFPACLHATNRLIVLEDLQPLGYTMADRHRGLSLQQATLALQALGRFHGTSLAMKHQQPALFAKATASLTELVFAPEARPLIGASLENALVMAMGALGTAPEMHRAVSRLAALRGTLFHRMAQLVAPQEPLAVVCHGDFWINNMLFKYDQSTAKSVMLVDLQVARYGPGSTDLLHLVYTSLEAGLRARSLPRLLAAYHAALEDTLARLAPTAPRPPLQLLLDDLDRHALYGLIIALLLLPAVTATSVPNLDEAIDGPGFDPNFLERVSLGLTPHYKERVKDIVLEFIDKGYI